MEYGKEHDFTEKRKRKKKLSGKKEFIYFKAKKKAETSTSVSQIQKYQNHQMFVKTTEPRAYSDWELQVEA